jgi:hypothetical protein
MPASTTGPGLLKGDMADDKTPKVDKETPKAPAKVAKSYTVTFSGITDKKGDLRLKGETVTGEELPDPEFQLSLGAIEEVAAEPSKTETK